MGSRSCAHSSAHAERHRLTSGWPVALMGVMAGSAETWCKTKQRKWGTAVGCHYEIPQSEWYLPSSKACSNKIRLWSRPEKSIDADALRARGTKRREVLALRDLLCLLVSASVEMSPSQKSTIGTSFGLEDEQRWNWPTSPLKQHVVYTYLTRNPWEHILWRQHRPCLTCAQLQTRSRKNPEHKSH